jgi:hypothetical protein
MFAKRSGKTKPSQMPMRKMMNAAEVKEAAARISSIIFGR